MSQPVPWEQSGDRALKTDKARAHPQFCFVAWMVTGPGRLLRCWSRRYRIRANCNELPVNAPKVPIHSYAKDGHMRHHNPGDPVYAPNSKGGPRADTERFGEPAGWQSNGDMVRAAATLHSQDDDFGQPGTLIREVLDDAARDRLVSNVVGILLDGVSEQVLLQTFDYWHKIDQTIGDRIETDVRSGQQQ